MKKKKKKRNYWSITNKNYLVRFGVKNVEEYYLIFLERRITSLPYQIDFKIHLNDLIQKINELQKNTIFLN